MDNDTPTTPRRTSILTRRVVVPGWLQTIILVAYAYAFIAQLIINPLRLLLILALSVAFGALILTPLRRRSGQGTVADDDAEVKAAPTQEAAISIRWRQFRTYQVWHLVILVVLSAAVLLDAAGIVATP